MTQELGPCPLCGMDAATYDGGVFCSRDDCDMGLYAFTEPTWNRLSTIAAQNRRRNLEWSALLKLIEWHGGGRIVDDIDDENETWRKCMEWAEEDRRKRNV